MGYKFKLIKPLEINKHKADVSIDGYDLKDTLDELTDILQDIDEDDYPYLNALRKELGVVHFNVEQKEKEFKKQLEEVQ